MQQPIGDPNAPLQAFQENLDNAARRDAYLLDMDHLPGNGTIMDPASGMGGLGTYHRPAAPSLDEMDEGDVDSFE